MTNTSSFFPKVATLMVGWCPPKSYAELLTTDTCECDLIWKSGLCRGHQEVVVLS